MSTVSYNSEDGYDWEQWSICSALKGRPTALLGKDDTAMSLLPLTVARSSAVEDCLLLWWQIKLSAHPRFFPTQSVCQLLSLLLLCFAFQFASYPLLCQPCQSPQEPFFLFVHCSVIQSFRDNWRSSNPYLLCCLESSCLSSLKESFRHRLNSSCTSSLKQSFHHFCSLNSSCLSSLNLSFHQRLNSSYLHLSTRVSAT